MRYVKTGLRQMAGFTTLLYSIEASITHISIEDIISIIVGNTRDDKHKLRYYQLHSLHQPPHKLNSTRCSSHTNQAILTSHH